MNDSTFVIFRYYNKKEKPDLENKYRSVLYGWSNNKSAVKAFLAQRNPKKYKVVKMNTDDLVESGFRDQFDYENMIDILVLKSAQDGQIINWFTTIRETQECEKKIQRLFYDASSLIGKYGQESISVYINLDDNYLNALDIIGFKPPEIEGVFDSIEYSTSGTRIGSLEEEIDSGYDLAVNITKQSNISPMGLNAINQAYAKMFYSLESFIKVLMEDL